MAQVYSKPDPLKPQHEKLQYDYGRRFAKYIVGKAVGSDFTYYQERRDRIREARAYAQGDQDNTRYKQSYNAEGDNSPKNLDFTPLGIGFKFFNSLLEDVMSEFEVNLKAIDPISMSKRKEKRDELLGAYYNRDYIKEIEEKTGIKFSEEEMIPESLEEVDIQMNVHYKQGVEIAGKQAIDYTLRILNDFPDEVRRNIAADIIAAGRGVGEVRFDPNYGIRTNYVDVENWVQSETYSPDGNDIQWGGEIKWMSISDVKRISDRELTDADLKEIHSKHRGRYGNEKFYGDHNISYNNTNDLEHHQRYYDTLTVPVLKFFFLSTDCDKYKVIKTKYGKEQRHRKPDTYETEYAKFKKEVDKRCDQSNRKPDKEEEKELKRLKEKCKNISVETDSYETIYEGYHIVNTDFVFNYGLMENMVRPKDNFKKVEPPYKAYAPSFYNNTNKSIIELIKPYIDQINLAHLGMQRTIVKSHPQITSINLDSWYELSMAGKQWSPLELQDIFEASDIVYHKGRDEEGNPIQNPVQHFSTHVNIEPFIATINHNINMIRETMGFVPERDGQTADDQLVGTTQIAIENSRNSTHFINHALTKISERMIDDVMWRIQDLPKDSRFYKIYEEAIGAVDMDVISSMKDLQLADLGIMISTEPDNEERLNLERDIQGHITQKELRIEDAMMIRKISKTAGIDTAYQYMKVRRDKYIKEQRQMIQAEKQADAKRQIDIQRATAAAERQKQQGQIQVARAEQQAETQSKLIIMKTEYRYKSLFEEQQHSNGMEKEALSEQGQQARLKQKEDAEDERAKLQNQFSAQKQEQIEKVKSGQQSEVDIEEIGKDGEFQELVEQYSDG